MTRLTLLLMLCVSAGPAFVAADEKEPEPVLDGYCLVSYFEKNEAVQGDPAYSVVYVSELYYFSSAEAKKKFETAPEKYLPQLGGLCTLSLGAEYGNRLPSDPTCFAIVDGLLYLFVQERAKRNWKDSPQDITKRAHELFDKPRLGGYCPVSYLRNNKAVKGDVAFRSVHKTYVYHLVSADAKAAFDKEPQKYLPPYWNYCATNIANRAMRQLDPTLFRVVDGKTYFFHDKDARKEFDADPKAIIRKANARWRYMAPK